MEEQYKYTDLSDFLCKHKYDKDKNSSSNEITHTRIPDKNLNIYGGSYHIPNEELPKFFELYYNHIFIKKKLEYLTEKQLDVLGPLLVDFDFRYETSVETKQHTNEHIQDMILLYLEELKELFIFEENKPFSIYIMEKPNVNRTHDTSFTKDGIHMIIGINVEHILQLMLRERILNKIGDIWDIPIINTWDKVLDEGISKGSTNWQMYGSRKPGNECYELNQMFTVNYDKNDGEFMVEENNIKDFDISKNLFKLSAQNKENPVFEKNPNILVEYNKKKENNEKKTSKINKISKIKFRLLDSSEDEQNNTLILIEEIDTHEKLKKAVENVMKNLKACEYYIKETHDYTQILPNKYYEPGSHLLNRQVAFALKHTDDRLFLSWVMLRSKADDFKFNDISNLYTSWKKYFNNNKSEIVTRKSIMYWAKQDAYDDYIKIKNFTIDHYIEETLGVPTEFDLAKVLYQIFKDKYVCSSIENKKWYVFKNNHWEVDRGFSIRLTISEEMYNIYQDKLEQCQNEMHHFDTNDERCEYIKKKIKSIGEISIKLKKTNDKNNIIREAMELFYDKDFVRNMDSNRMLMCFENGVIDFKTKEFRSGYPQDYITKTTGVSYNPFDDKNNKMKEMADQITTFMKQLFPVPELNKYMWQHLASCLIGTNVNQTFNVYRGSGSNGKAKLTDLMTYTLGDYKGTVPITLVTEKRNTIGGTSSEIIQLKGIRYAVMQEPSKDARINEGVMKELTGGDPIQARALYSESETFVPQFKLVVCTNHLFEINSNDDGTWRRFRICDFMSKFVGENETHTDDTPYVFPKDKDLDEKLVKWAPVFASMLVKIVFETDGFVEDCDIVKLSTSKYRQGQDHIAAFVAEKVIHTKNNSDKIKKTELTNEFKIWFQNCQGVRKTPKGVELYEYMDKVFGKCKTTGWHGVKMYYPDNELDEMDELVS